VAKTVLIFAPHPDDAEYYAGGTIAGMRRDGAHIILVTVTDGSKGSFENTSSQLASIRYKEAHQAAEVLGAQLLMLGYTDFELDKLPPGALREQFIHLIRQHKPDVVITEDTSMLFESHPDHRAVARAAAEALQFSYLPLLHPEHQMDGMQPHFVVEKYFYTDNPASINKIVDITSTFTQKMAALAEHKSQVKFLVEDIFNQAQMAGVDLTVLSGGEMPDHLSALTWVVQNQASGFGKQAGCQFGEAFRYVRFHPLIENLLLI
jgi:N,N'-diacetylchitobiose non-reducing end deacetylase